jgi:DNA polymerase theta
VISIRLATSFEAIRDHFSQSLLRYTHGIDYLDKCLESSLKEIEGMGFVTKDLYSNYAATQLGKAIVASALDPDDGIFIHRELSRALQAFVLDGELHMLYTFTPVQEVNAPVNWQVFRDEIGSLDESGMRVVTLLGISPPLVVKL